MCARRRLSESAVNRQEELRGNAVTRLGSSVRTPQSLSGCRDISTCGDAAWCDRAFTETEANIFQ
uniref:Uncharacterized protein n=1 Tax=Magallana gigas TaxID=29159 RepID=K1S005_MAGGI